jgi:3'-phosphoadenosine 5'-phosphosulfate sulfotransferase (PAPS reductase)/FAD synthetase
MRQVVINFSGGKDSSAAVLDTLKVYPRNEIVLCYQNTGADYIETPEHVRKFAADVNLPLVELQAKKEFWTRVKERRMFPGPDTRFCTAELKRNLTYKYIRSLQADEIILVTGIRAEESSSRAKLPEMDINEELTTRTRKVTNWRPVLNMKAQEVKDMVKAEGLELHPCYKFSTRCNCWLCFFASYNEVRSYAEMHPDLWEQACTIEESIKFKWKEKFALQDLMKQKRLF